jgi:hypothetical protein
MEQSEHPCSEPDLNPTTSLPLAYDQHELISAPEHTVSHGEWNRIRALGTLFSYLRNGTNKYKYCNFTGAIGRRSKMMGSGLLASLLTHALAENWKGRSTLLGTCSCFNSNHHRFQSTAGDALVVLWERERET